MTGRNPYVVLGVGRDASTRQIRAAYVARARRAHPDLVGQHGTEVMRALNEAWALLKDPSRRSAYDAGDQQTMTYVAEPTREHGPKTGNDAAKPFWTGAAGPAPGRPSGPVLDFGIFAGWSLGEIAHRDRGYLVWLRNRPEAAAIRSEIASLLDPNAEATPEVGRTRRR